MIRWLFIIFVILQVASVNAQNIIGGVDDSNRIDTNDIDRYLGTQFIIFGAVGTLDYDLTAAGNSSINLGGNVYSRYGAGVKWKSKKTNWGAETTLESRDVTVKSPTGFQPTSVNSVEQVGKAVVNLRAFKESGSWLDPMEVGLGYWFSQRSADSATPGPVISAETLSGPLFELNYFHKLNNVFNYNARIDFGFVNSFHEKTASTGFYSSGYRLDTKYLLAYPMSQYVDVSFGLQFFYNTINFSGTGSRALSNARETTLGYGIPLEITIFF